MTRSEEVKLVAQILLARFPELNREQAIAIAYRIVETIKDAE